MAEVQQCYNGACVLDPDLETRSKFRAYESSVGTAAFRLVPLIGVLLVLAVEAPSNNTKRTHIAGLKPPMCSQFF